MLTTHQREVLALHFNPRHGSRYWIERADQLDVDPLAARTLNELLELLGPMDPEALCSRPALDFVPAALQHTRSELLICETGGTTGQPTTTVYHRDDFYAAFVAPFVLAARHVGFPTGGQWLWAGPSGPHIIGRAAEALAQSMAAAAPFMVDFDPRWFRKLAAGSLARDRYLDHVVAQAAAILQREPIDVLFTTPAVLDRLALEMSEARRLAVRGVHYGGQRITREALLRFQTELFPNAVHLSGYGNSLFGCCLELDVRPGRTPVYFPYLDRLAFHGMDEAGTAARQVMFSRFDKSGLIIGLRERDEAHPVHCPEEAPPGFAALGLADPRPAACEQPVDIGLY